MPMAAHAAMGPTAAGLVPVVDPYVPTPHMEPTLAGSVVASECLGDVPWIGYSVSMDDPASLATGNTASLYITDGANSVTVPLGELVDGALSGRVLWPGASVDASGNPTGWPGWVQQADGTWVETTGNYAWTRGNISAELRVNPVLAVPLSYPPSTPGCANGPTVTPAGGNPQAAGVSDPLAATGMPATALPLAVGIGGALLLCGVAILLVRRAARR